MWNKTVQLRTFIVTIGALAAGVLLVLLLLQFATNKDSTLATGEETESVSSVDITDTFVSTPVTSQEVPTSEVVVSTTDSSVSTTAMDTSTSTDVEQSSTESNGSAKGEIIVIGDSLTAQQDTPPVLIPKLIANGWQEISINAQGGRKNYGGDSSILDFVTMLKLMENNSYDVNTSGGNVPGARQDVIKRLYQNDPSTLSKISDSNLNDAFRQADTVVVSLGTNDRPEPEKIKTGIRQTIASIRNINPDINIQWVIMCSQGNIKGKGDTFNPILKDLSQELNFALVDWESKCQPSHQSDGVHYNPQGVEAYTDALAAGIR